ncbi:MAG TPA: hypothetical protein VGH98_23075 [Gemmatimonadaceae bacterium]
MVEHFPVGQRLAFDAGKGRLWVVCGRCERWNLTPLEERWEAIEECEHAFRATTLRVSTDNIGLARLRDGTELVRIGKPLRPELAAWRYGDQFGRRRRRMLLRSGLSLAVVGGTIAGGAAMGFSMVGGWWLMYQAARAVTRGSPEAIVAVITDARGAPLRITRAALALARLAWDVDTYTWALELPAPHSGTMLLHSEDAMRAAALLMPAANRYGGSAAVARQAVALFEEHGDPESLFHAMASEWDGTAAGYRDLPNGRIAFVAHGPHGYLTRLAPARRLALEMAAHEDTERLALEGELRELEAAWRRAEEIAAIADDLLLPPGVGRFLRERGDKADAR